MDDFSIKHILSSQLGLPANQKPKPPTEQEEDVECCDTKVWLWDGDQYEDFDSDYLNQIFPYKINKKTMTPGSKFLFHFLASSMHYWVELVEDPQSAKNNKIQQKPLNEPNTQLILQPKKQPQQQQEKLGLKHVKFLKNIFLTDESDNYIAFNRWGQQFMEKQKFMAQQQHEATWQPPQGGQLIHTYTRNNEEFVIIKYLGDNKNFVEFKERMEVMFLFYIDGVSFVKEEVDTWMYFMVFKKKPTNRHLFVGALSKYVFKLSTVKQRHRISQVFILPNYQKHGHGKELLDVVYKRSLQDSNCFQITTQIPSFEYQCLRDFKEAEMIIDSKIIDTSTIKAPTNARQITNARDQLLNKDALREIKLKLKLPGHQIQRIAQIFIFEKILASKDDMARAHFEEYLRQKIIFNRSPFKSRSKLPHITFFGESPQMKQFYLQKVFFLQPQAKQDFLRNQEQIQEILLESIKGYQRVIVKLQKAKKI